VSPTRETGPVVILGAGAAGLICAREAAARGREVLLLDHQTRPGRKLAITGGGHCNISNHEIKAARYISGNPHFVKSALARYGVWDILELALEAGITTHEREHGELFCDQRASQLVTLLERRARQAGARFLLGRPVTGVRRGQAGGFRVALDGEELQAAAVVVATGGRSYPSTGASELGYRVAEAFDIPVTPLRPGLAPLQWSAEERERFSALAGNSLPVRIRCPGSPRFERDLLFTHRGISGPAALQVSSYWLPGQPVTIDLLPDGPLEDRLLQARQEQPRASLQRTLGRWLPKRLIAALTGRELPDEQLARLSDKRIRAIAQALHGWTVHPAGTAGWGAAEVTVGGVDTHAISSQTLEAHAVPGLYFVGEVLDVTGWLGGYNLQWAWSSGWCAGQAV
jgi:predicted Rossmann fold flavoprotein